MGDVMADRRLDSFDRKILTHLQEQGDLGPSELSALVNLSASQCSRRLQRLKDEGYLDRIVALLSPERLNLGISAYVTIKLSSHSEDAERRFRERVQTLPEIVSCDYLTGETDFMLRVWTKDLESFSRFLSTKLLPAPEIETARSSIILSSLKSTTTLSLEYC
jgi:Lrp/AsnC family leucine-responsive transcriptional regulator